MSERDFAGDKVEKAFLMSTDLNDVILLLEDSACQWTLAAVVQSVGVRSMLNEKSHEVGVAVVCRQHQLLCLSASRCAHADISVTARQKGGERAVPGCDLPKKLHTSVSPLSLVRLGGRPAETACVRSSLSPCLAALYMRDASSMASGGSEEPADGPGPGLFWPSLILLIFLQYDVLDAV